MAVLVQPLLEPRAGGVQFGVDPVTGRRDRRVIAVVSGAPENLVSGTVSGARYELTEKGHEVSFTPDADDPIRLHRRDLDRVLDAGRAHRAGLRRAARRRVGARARRDRAPAAEPAGHHGRRRGPAGPVLGPGPVAETFPDPLSRLEQDLWVEPLRRAIREVFAILGAVSPARLAAVSTRHHRRRSGRGRSRPVRSRRVTRAGTSVVARCRAVRTAWRVGRLRAALPAIGTDVVRQADATLLDVPHPSTLTDRQLIATLERARRRARRAAHARDARRSRARSARVAAHRRVRRACGSWRSPARTGSPRTGSRSSIPPCSRWCRRASVPRRSSRRAVVAPEWVGRRRRPGVGGARGPAAPGAVGPGAGSPLRVGARAAPGRHTARSTIPDQVRHLDPRVARARRPGSRGSGAGPARRVRAIARSAPGPVPPLRPRPPGRGASTGIRHQGTGAGGGRKRGPVFVR